MKRWFSILLALTLCLFLFACGKQPAQTPPADDPPPMEVPPVDPPAQDPVTPPEEPVPADPLPGEQVAPEIPQIKHSHPMFTFTDDKEEPLLILTASIPHFALPQINDYYQSLYDDLYALCQLNTEDAARQKAEMEAMGQEFTPWSARLLPLITRNDGVTLSVQRTVIEKQGEQETQHTYAETFDVASQGRLLLSDLFQPGADYQSFWTDTGELDQLNFAITEDAVVVCGENGGAVPLSELSDILLPQYVTE